MIIACPTCYTRFTVPDNTIPPAGRRVRCQKCTSVWHHVPDRIEEAPESMPVAEPVTIERRREPEFGSPVAADTVTEIPARRFALGRLSREQIGWGALAAVVLVVTGLFVGAPGWLTTVWPATARLYQSTGVAQAVVPPSLDLGIEQVSTTKASIDGKPSLSIAGEVVNHAGDDRGVPQMRVVLHGVKGAAIRTVDFFADRQTVPAKKSVHFQAVIPEPPAEAVSADVTFAVERQQAAADLTAEPTKD